MRQITVGTKPVRGSIRRLRALERWALGFHGSCYPQSEHKEAYKNWKIPVHSGLVQGPRARVENQAFCIQQLLETANHLSKAADRSVGYYRVACLLVWPWVHQSEVTVFYDRDYYLGFLGQANTLESDLLSQTLALHLPGNFIEHGHDVTQPEDEVEVQWWCIGEPA